MTLKDCKWDVMSKATVFAFIAYVVILFYYSAVELTNKKTKFAYSTEFIDKQKQRLVYTSLFVNTVLYIDNDILDNVYSEADKYGIDIFIYPLSGQEPKYEGSEDTVMSSMVYAFGNMNSFIEDENALTYYRSYEGLGKIFTLKEIDGSKLGSDTIGKERCRENNLCSTYATKESLSDRILVSNVYRDQITGATSITLSSPVIVQGNIIGDISVDMYLESSMTANSSSVENNNKGGINYITINYPGYPMYDLSFRSTYVVDNKSVIVYEYPLSKLFIDTLPILATLFIISVFGTVQYKRYKSEKTMISRVYEESNRDDMTGLYNRKIFSTQKFLSDTVNQTLAVLAIDGNKLKHINDTYGHHYGDAAIKCIADSMTSVFRESDYLVRSGGDEFLAILPGCTTERALELKERLQQELSRKSSSLHNIKVSVSVGIAFKRPEDDLEYALVAADESLYEDKSSSREAES
ncbi:diguanylate cyclase domain-containing protein [Vibrio sp. TBV020]|uniref:sensor domain-containing diguanylate cyclase n=1 Tax=Vibrio sp. TBV020 TaxID=3137398 RepID=UPI0038CD6F44